jgi:pyruvate carboxylase
MHPGDEVKIALEHGKNLYIKMLHISNVNELGTRDVHFEMNGSHRIVKVGYGHTLC